MAQKTNRADGPSGFVGFEDVYGANAGAAKASADKLTSDFTNAATGAQDALQKAYGNFQAGGNQGEFKPGDDVTTQYGKVLGMRNALTGTGQPGGPTAQGGVQALLGGGATDMDAMFARRAGGNFADLKEKYSGFDPAEGGVHRDIKERQDLAKGTQTFKSAREKANALKTAAEQRKADEYVDPLVEFQQQNALIDQQTAASDALGDPSAVQRYMAMGYSQADAEEMARNNPDAGMAHGEG